MLAKYQLGVPLLVMCLAIGGCGNEEPADFKVQFPEALVQAEQAKPAGEAPLSGRIVVDGSSTVCPLSRTMASEFRKANSGISRSGCHASRTEY